MGSLWAEAIRQFKDQDYYAPIRTLTKDEADTLRGRLESLEAANSELRSGLRNKPHLLFTWLDDSSAIRACSMQLSR